ncbi:hypothetical protein QQP08_027332, partial [Theobroma cacao]
PCPCNFKLLRPEFLVYSDRIPFNLSIFNSFIFFLEFFKEGKKKVISASYYCSVSSASYFYLLIPLFIYFECFIHGRFSWRIPPPLAGLIVFGFFSNKYLFFPFFFLLENFFSCSQGKLGESEELFSFFSCKVWFLKERRGIRKLGFW